MFGTFAWGALYIAFTPLRWSWEWLDWAIFWRKYARIRAGGTKAEGILFPSKAQALIADAEVIEVFSLGEFATDSDGTFDGWRVIGQTTVKDVEMCKLLAQRLLIANEASERGWKCIDGGYGMRITTSGIAIDVMICFACGNAWLSGDAGCSGMGNVCSVPLGYLLKRILRRAGIALPQPGLHA